MVASRDVCLFVLLVGILRAVRAGPVFDFEDPEEVTDYISSEGCSVTKQSQNHAKSGEYSLMWAWPKITTATKLRIHLKEASLGKMEIKKGGFKFWMYIPADKGEFPRAQSESAECNDATKIGRLRLRGFRDRMSEKAMNRSGSPRKDSAIGAKMEIVFKGKTKDDKPKEYGPVTANLGFIGWRAVWIAYQEFKIKPGTDNALVVISEVEFAFPEASDKAGGLYLDLVRFAPSIKMETRDTVVPKVVDDVTRAFDERKTWQQSLRWSMNEAPAPSKDDSTGINDIQEIEDRLENWYARTDKDLPFPLLDSGHEDESVEAYKAARLKGLLKSIRFAHKHYDRLWKKSAGAKDEAITGPPLFSKVSEYGEEKLAGQDKVKFTFIMEKVLLPLALEYNLRGRRNEVAGAARRECKKLSTEDPNTRRKGLENIAGDNEAMMEFLDTQLSGKTLDCNEGSANEDLKSAIDALNQERLRRLVALFDYLQDQGWDRGSGLGSLDHEMNKDGAGFLNALFLLRNAFKRDHREKFKHWIETAKWYADFNEIYQTKESAAYDGTTADRMRTILLHRLMIVLMAPYESEAEQVRDMNGFKTWVEIVLRVNKGLGGVVKPDYTGFHHMTFYGSAYVTHAYHNAALVQYLVDGTQFALCQEAKENLKKGLETIRVTAVKYSTPNGICGRFPDYHKAELARLVPAYAYISCKHSLQEGGIVEHDTSAICSSIEGPEMFLRLYDLQEDSVKEYLGKGEVYTSIYYLNSIGSLDIMDEVRKRSLKDAIGAEPSPTGHWSFNFAALSIHRRDDWSAAVKGFNKYVWDWESSNNQNLYGIFGSYGSLQLSNSESALASYDVKNGWDWTRVPGATTINFKLEDIKSDDDRYYNPKAFAGGVSLRGTKGKSWNGGFGMDFEIPKYEIDNDRAALKNVYFKFKKSYFFVNNLIIAVGSDITLMGINGLNLPDSFYPQTTLFQDKLVRSANKIEINGVRHDLRVVDEGHPKTKRGDKKAEDKRADNILDAGMEDTGHDLGEVGDKSDRRKKKEGTSGKKIEGPVTKASSKCMIMVEERGEGLDSVEDTGQENEGWEKDDDSVNKEGSHKSGRDSQGRGDVKGTRRTSDQTLFIAVSIPAFNLIDDGEMESKPACQKPKDPKALHPKNLSGVTERLLYCAKSDNSKVTLDLSKPVSSEVEEVWDDNDDDNDGGGVEDANVDHELYGQHGLIDN
ncbi:predicted protein [Nematostella vectensis]|uniref:Chondroitin sulfate ABC exolyase n=1 Tax=Nematostella vectensis TaxID=45351 RepID=A7SSN9_NEMVE|nr:predicted protein [Nematostella vectensis]|eukprot:XP_001625383.1 predicted protein [Nematostella vectensis]